jgi:hypothetical protein
MLLSTQPPIALSRVPKRSMVKFFDDPCKGMHTLCCFTCLPGALQHSLMTPATGMRSCHAQHICLGAR